MSAISKQRLQKELSRLQKECPPLIRAQPQENDIHVWHYVIEGAPDSPYAGGYYHGTLNFPSEYPLKPPAVRMITPSGRFAPNERICLSMSDYHPESWNPVWGVEKILLGLQSFMQSNEPATGCVQTSDAAKITYARQSLSFNVNNTVFAKLFPELIELNKKLSVITITDDGNHSSSSSSNSSSSSSSSSSSIPVNNSNKKAKVVIDLTLSDE